MDEATAREASRVHVVFTMQRQGWGSSSGNLRDGFPLNCELLQPKPFDDCSYTRKNCSLLGNILLHFHYNSPQLAQSPHALDSYF
jgi:hypothetical protein